VTAPRLVLPPPPTAQRPRSGGFPDCPRPPPPVSAPYRGYVAAAATLQRRGLRAAVIDSTTLTTFHGRLGARVWRSYQRAEGGP
jgi:hypothetical protein